MSLGFIPVPTNSATALGTRSRWPSSGYVFLHTTLSFPNPSIFPQLPQPDQASEDALHRVYLTQTPRTLLQLPTSTFPAGYNVFRAHPKLEGHYTAPDLVIPEIMYASSGKSSAIVPRTPSLE